ncbi:MAG: hypothetical protein Q7V12_11750, partial [Deltaproteobacteria bacterium]|nr:hypothetical protein [Deltaproteobacteria bacterium]
LIVWFIIGVIVGYLKIRQSRQFGFDRKIEFATLSYFVIGVALWPLLLFYIFREKKIHKEAYLRSLMDRSEFDKELDEIERELDKMEGNTKE